MAFLGEVHTTNRISSHLELFVLDLPAKPRDLRISERGKPLRIWGVRLLSHRMLSLGNNMVCKQNK